jgi:hypothetical protein
MISLPILKAQKRLLIDLNEGKFFEVTFASASENFLKFLALIMVYLGHF